MIMIFFVRHRLRKTIGHSTEKYFTNCQRTRCDCSSSIRYINMELVAVFLYLIIGENRSKTDMQSIHHGFMFFFKVPEKRPHFQFQFCNRWIQHCVKHKYYVCHQLVNWLSKSKKSYWH